jgi:hypothetical protein
MSWFSRSDKAEQAGDALAAQLAQDYPEYDSDALHRAWLAALSHMEALSYEEGQAALQALAKGYQDRTCKHRH